MERGGGGGGGLHASSWHPSSTAQHEMITTEEKRNKNKRWNTRWISFSFNWNLNVIEILKQKAAMRGKWNACKRSSRSWISKNPKKKKKSQMRSLPYLSDSIYTQIWSISLSFFWILWFSSGIRRWFSVETFKWQRLVQDRTWWIHSIWSLLLSFFKISHDDLGQLVDRKLLLLLLLLLFAVTADRVNFWVEVTYTHRAEWDRVRFACHWHHPQPLVTTCCKRAVPGRRCRK